MKVEYDFLLYGYFKESQTGLTAYYKQHGGQDQNYYHNLLNLRRDSINYFSLVAGIKEGNGRRQVKCYIDGQELLSSPGIKWMVSYCSYYIIWEPDNSI